MQGLFEFEQHDRYPLRRIPMIMRFNLDACGVKIALTAWITLSHDEREELLVMPCASETEKDLYRTRLAAMLAQHADNPGAVIEFVEIEAAPAWMDSATLPQNMNESLEELGLPLPNLTLWAALNDLQRFALIKLTRSGHKNANLLPAMKEFGLI